MQNKTYNRLLFLSLFFLAQWFFGNLYEEIVLAPNQLSNAYQALKSWQAYFTITNQIYYYVPFTQLAVFVLVYLYLKTTQAAEKVLLRKAIAYGFAAIVLTILIVTQLNFKLFLGDLEKYKTELYTLSVVWLIGNAIRICLVGGTMYFIFQLYILRCTLEKTENIAQALEK